MNPHLDICVRYHAKETQLVYDVDAFMSEHKFEVHENVVRDRRIGGCSARRPDYFIDCLTHTVVIECDENRHHGYSCETARMCEIYEDTAHRNIVFLRFNPDSYTDSDGVKHKSSFQFSKSRGFTQPMKDYYRRLAVLLERLEYHLNHVPDKAMTIEEFFYE